MKFYGKHKRTHFNMVKNGPATLILWAYLSLVMCVALSMARSNPPDQTDEMLETNNFRSSPFTEEEIDQMVDWHNFARSTADPPATNMEYIDWDPYLQDIAQRWADKCLWQHGRPSDVVGSYGQNLWAIKYPGVPKAESVVKGWDDEKHDYNLSTNACKQGKQCGHYTQVVWSSTNSIGCGKAFCPNLEGAMKNMWIVVCQYSPAGNVVGFSPYDTGPSCSRCRSGVGQCYENLCRSCERHDEHCDCRQSCNNCGTVDKETCTCQCPQGYHGTDCSSICTDTHPYCGRSPGFPNSGYCHYHPIIPRLCPKMCGACQIPDENISCEETTTMSTTETKTTPEMVEKNDDITNNEIDDKKSSMINDAIERK
ncbi:hypothetical protein BSL78_08259 [Apostichopus japonicus]|uniref:SCP domain-containing protein n=1 Tax=Stichopus japonicus TaxID=307972 RepID=A0A2G8L3W3_STIJA|nr:hypothetical protein BSL78_08259 [Apostichopus japonicus]